MWNWPLYWPDKGIYIHTVATYRGWGAALEHRGLKDDENPQVTVLPSGRVAGSLGWVQGRYDNVGACEDAVFPWVCCDDEVERIDLLPILPILPPPPAIPRPCV